MTASRYQIFISSTFRDLVEERQAVLDAVLSLGHFPAGMELFPASDSTPWELIERVIAEADYYVLVLGGMYGSVDSAGVSYTEKEYDLARSRDIPILTFLPADPERIPSGKVEASRSARERLNEFRKKVSVHHCKYWESVADLQYKVALGLVNEMNTNPGVGWVRGSIASHPGSATEARLRDEVDQLQGQVKTLEAQLRDEGRSAERLNALVESAQEEAKIAIQRQQETEAEAEELRARLDRYQTDTVSEATPSNWKSTLLLDVVREVLAGKTDRIGGFAIWSDTPQGHEFWSREQRRTSAGEPLSDEARAALEELLSEAAS